MSTVNAMADVQTGQEVVLPERMPSELTEPKFTAAQIEKNCPARLQDLAKEITEGLEKFYKQKKLADDQVIAVKKLIAEVKALCDVGGFAAFREKFFPNLRKSRAYELLAIATNKKSVEEARASNRKRQAKHGANKAGALNSVTVTEKSEPEPEVLGTPTEDSAVQATSSATAQTSAPTKPLSLAKKIALVGFSAAVRELDRVTSNKKAKRFAKTSVTADDLAKLGKFLIDLANIKKSEAVKPAPIMALPDNGIVPAAQSAGNMKANTALRSKSQSGGVT